MNTKHTWHKGPPPFPGFWLTRISTMHTACCWRFFDGQYASIPMGEQLNNLQINKFAASVSAFDPDELLWSDYWPENARVPRIDPR